MADDPELGSDSSDSPDSPWQQRAVERSLSTARARAVSRSGQILDAARSLMQESGGIDFTVQDIVDRSGLSLRSFYKHFAGKDELLLALFEELLRGFAADLRTDVEAHADPVDQLRAYIAGFHDRARQSSAHGGRALGSYHLRMLEIRHREFASALGPQMELLAEIIEQGVAAGRFRQDLEPQQLTGLLTVTLMSIAQMSVLDVDLTGTPLEGDDLWLWCAAAVGVEPTAGPASGAAPGATKRPTKRASKRSVSRPAPAPARGSG